MACPTGPSNEMSELKSAGAEGHPEKSGEWNVGHTHFMISTSDTPANGNRHTTRFMSQ